MRWMTGAGGASRDIGRQLVRLGIRRVGSRAIWVRWHGSNCQHNKTIDIDWVRRPSREGTEDNREAKAQLPREFHRHRSIYYRYGDQTARWITSSAASSRSHPVPNTRGPRTRSPTRPPATASVTRLQPAQAGPTTWIQSSHLAPKGSMKIFPSGPNPLPRSICKARLPPNGRMLSRDDDELLRETAARATSQRRSPGRDGGGSRHRRTPPTATGVVDWR
jgi:hypothetical protein